MNANSPRIGGLEPLEPPELATDIEAASESGAAGAEAGVPLAVPPKSSKVSLGTIGVIAAMFVAAVAVVCASLQQQKVQALRLQLNRVQAATQAVLNTVNSLNIPKDLSADLASLEATVNKLRSANEARQQSFNEEIKKIQALDNGLTEQANALVSRQAELGRDIKAFQAAEDQRSSTIVTVLKNQDKILRQLVEGRVEPPKGSNPEVR